MKVHLNPNNNLPTIFGYDSDELNTATNVLSKHILMVHATNTNMTAQEKELVRWHHHLGHIGFRKVQALMQTGILVTSEAQRRLHAAACKILQPLTSENNDNG